MVSRGIQALFLGVALCGPVGVLAQAEDEDIPDMEFLEYLGLWDESDDEWLLLDEDEVTDTDERSDPVPEGEESTETDDAS